MSDKYKNNDYIYSTLVDIAIAYGTAYLHSELDSDNSRELWDEATTCIDPLDDLSTGTKKLTQAVKTAMRVLADWSTTVVNAPDPVTKLRSFSPGIVAGTSYEGDEMEVKLSAALMSFDHLVSFSIAYNRFSSLQDEQFGPLREQTDNLYDKVEEKYRQEGWKLMPLNRERKIRLDKIPGKHHYLFPWYEEWSDVPAESFDMLIEAMAGLPVDESLISKDRLMMLQVEVESDPDFFNMLTQQAVLARELPQAFQESYALQLEQAAEPKQHKEETFIKEAVSGWKDTLKDFFASFKMPQFAAAAAMACLLVVLITLYQPDQKTVAPKMTNLQLYGVTLHTNRAGGKKISLFELQTGESLTSEDFFQIHFSLDKDGFVSVIQQSDDEQPHLKFSGMVKAEEEIILPSVNQAFPLDEAARVENIYLLLSDKEIQNIKAVLPTLHGDWAEDVNKYFPGANLKTFMFQH